MTQEKKTWTSLFTAFTDAHCEDLYVKCLDATTMDRQALHLSEEMSELNIAVSHFIRARVHDLDNVVEEMADVIIMVDEIRHLFGISRDALQNSLDAKMLKFSNKINAGAK